MIPLALNAVVMTGITITLMKLNFPLMGQAIIILTVIVIIAIMDGDSIINLSMLLQTSGHLCEKHLCGEIKSKDWMKNNMEYNLELEKEKKCWLYEYGCPCRTAGCWGLPDDGCPVYRWFKEVIKYQESIK